MATLEALAVSVWNAQRAVRPTGASFGAIEARKSADSHAGRAIQRRRGRIPGMGSPCSAVPLAQRSKVCTGLSGASDLRDEALRKVLGEHQCDDVGES